MLPLMRHPFLSLSTVLAWEPTMARLGVSEVARSPRGFVRAFEELGHSRLTDYWYRRREGFISRHMAQIIANDEPLYDKHGLPTRRHLALVAWAFSPDPRNLAVALDHERRSTKTTSKKGKRR